MIQAGKTKLFQGVIHDRRRTVRVLAGELRSIHDLLYRPRQSPEEKALEAILASLAAVFEELSYLLAIKGGHFSERSAHLHASLQLIKRHGNEIRGECVPRDYAPDLKIWMDRIQELSSKLQ